MPESDSDKVDFLLLTGKRFHLTGRNRKKLFGICSEHNVFTMTSSVFIFIPTLTNLFHCCLATVYPLGTAHLSVGKHSDMVHTHRYCDKMSTRAEDEKEPGGRLLAWEDQVQER